MFTITVFKKDGRCKNGTKVISRKDVEEFKMSDYDYLNSSYIVDVKPWKKVKNLMTGAEFLIAPDTPRCCDPSTELYWSM